MRHSQKGVEHQEQQGDPQEKGQEAEALEEEIKDDAASLFGLELLGYPLFFIALPLVATSLP